MCPHKSFTSLLVTPQQLFDALTRTSHGDSDTRIILLSAAWFLPGDGRKGIDSFQQKHILGSRFCDLDSFADKTSPFAHMLPTAEQFSLVMSSLGITAHDTVVVYDTEELGLFSAPRVAWTLEVFGHEQVYILNSFKLWVQLGLPTTTGRVTESRPTVYSVPVKNSRQYISFDDLYEMIIDGFEIGTSNFQILDSRAPGRWHRQESDLSTGHIPFSINLPLSKVINPSDGTILEAAKLRAVLVYEGVDDLKALVTSCGAGITAAVLHVVLREAGYGNTVQPKLYDGSWREWSHRTTPDQFEKRR